MIVPDLRPPLYVLGLLLCVLAGLEIVPLVESLISRRANTQPFLLGFLFTAASGIFLVARCRHAPRGLSIRQMFLLTALVWVGISAFGAIPFWLSQDLDLSLTDALFESVSGVTTTGSTVLSGLDSMSPAILLWRSMLQWLGGIGIIAMAVAILPFLRVGGMRLFRTESSDWSAKALPRARDIVNRLIAAYLVISVLCAASYWAAGMTGFDAINHAMTTIATGGYSTHDASMGFFEQPLIHWLATIFIAIAGLPFILYVRMIAGDSEALWDDEQVRGFLRMLALVIGFVATVHWWQNDIGLWTALTHAAFNVTSVVTTTGYAVGDYSLWGTWAVLVFFFLTFSGGCSGSTTGGIKFFRFQIAWKMLRRQIKRLTHPSGMFIETFNGRPVDDAILTSVAAFAFAFAMSVIVVAVTLAVIGLDPMTALSGAATAMANVGPGLGDHIGPAGNFGGLPDAAKWVLMVAMLLGRLEIFTVLVLLSRAFWRG